MLGAYYMDEDIVNDRSVLFRDTAGIRNVVNTLLAIQGAPNITQVAGLVGTSTIQQIAALPSATQAAAGFGILLPRELVYLLTQMAIQWVLQVH